MDAPLNCESRIAAHFGVSNKGRAADKMAQRYRALGMARESLHASRNRVDDKLA